VCSPDVLVVEDATQDYRFANNPLVTGPPNIRFYAGAALIIDDVRVGRCATPFKASPRMHRQALIRRPRMPCVPVLMSLPSPLSPPPRRPPPPPPPPPPPTPPPPTPPRPPPPPE